MASDNTQFLIDMAAKLTGGAESIQSLADLGDRLLAAGTSASGFDAVIARTSAALEESANAMKVNADAVSAGEARYRELEATAAKTSKTVEQIGLLAEAQRGKLAAAMDAGDAQGADRATAKLGALMTRQAEATARADAATAALEAEAMALDDLKASAAAVATEHEALTKGLKNVQAGADKAAKAEKEAKGSRNVNEIAEAMGKLGGPAGIAGQKIFGLATGFKKLGQSLGTAGPYIAVAVAIVAITTAAIAGTAAIAKWGVTMADANRSQSLLAAGVARSVEGGRELEATVTRLGDVVPQSRDELMAMASDLAKTGLRGKELTAALEESAVKAAKLKWGPEFGKQLLALDVQSRRLGSNLAGTFGGLKIDKLLGGFSTLVALFDSNTASGRALKFIFETLFQPIIDGIADAIPKVERFFLHAVILALQAYIALKPYQGAIKAIAQGFAIATAVVVGVFGVAVLAVMAHVVAAVAGPVAILGALIAVVIKAVQVIRDGFGGAVTFMSDLGAAMVKGLVDGITAGAGAVVGAIGNVVGGAIDSAKNLLGIASPSKVFAGIGQDTAAGFAGGIDDGSAEASSSLESLVAPPRAAAAGAAGGGGGVSVVIQQLIVQGDNAKELATDFVEQLTRLLEGDALSVGGGEVPAGA